MSPLVGRTTEQFELAQLLAGAANGRGGFVLISGDAGIGKTSLAESALVPAAAAGLRVVRTRAVDDPGAPPLWIWRRLGRSVPEIGRLLDDEAVDQAPADRRLAVFAAVVDHLLDEATRTGLVVLLDDLHWADPGSLALLRLLADEAADARLLLVGTARRSGGPAWDRGATELLRRPTMHPMPLSGLTLPDVREWLGSSPRRREWSSLAEQLHEVTGGNPFYLTLMTSAPAGAGTTAGRRPDIVAEVTARLRRLSPATRDLAETVALLGDLATRPLVGMIIARSDAEVASAFDDAVRAEILQPVEGPAITHALVRDAITAGLPARRRSELHRRIARALESGGDPLTFGAIAGHWRQVDDRDSTLRSVVWARRAAVVAGRHLDLDGAVSVLADALERAERAGLSAVDLAELAAELAEARFRAGDVVGATDTCLRVGDLAGTSGRPDLLARAALTIRGIGDWRSAGVIVDLCERALRALPDGADVLRARVCAQLSATLTETVDPARGAELARNAVAMARQCGDPMAELEAIAARHLAITVPATVGERERLARRAVELAAAPGVSSVDRVLAHLWLLMALHQSGQVDGAREQAAAIGRIAEQHRSSVARWHDLRVTAAMAELTGDFDRARRLNRASLDVALRMGDESMLGVHQSFRLFLGVVRGDPGEIDDDAVRMLRSETRIPLVRALLVLALTLRGERAEAIAVFDQLRALPDEMAGQVRWAGTINQIGLAAVALDDAEVAGRVFDAIRGSGGPYDGDGSGFIVAMGAVSRQHADYALAAGRLEEAISLYREAEPLNIRIGARPFTALTRLGWATALVRRYGSRRPGADPADLVSASTLLELADGEFHRLDMPGPSAAASRLRRAIVELSPRPPASKTDRLTAREAEVARLVASGQRNREIATALFLSERTVESHVRNVLAKLQLHNRVEIAAWAARRPDHEG
ncbi:hypothetical protein FDO65_14645 [Nakamurella flava]|uniref:HTH luxR-type domain-containing protein n=1 Tax=Nakamurella flava TaxID=2576308 RepID=A0A4U6QF36_9ACTN|nr:LuxR family transcriptional regulator [Nakamurella flava]TKV58750.1 hypothetical protein FDO65_14645 [Nakamurella flava]